MHANTQLTLSGTLASFTRSPACWRPQSSGRLPGNITSRSLPGLEFFLAWKLSHGSMDLTSPLPQHHTPLSPYSRGRATAAARWRNENHHGGLRRGEAHGGLLLVSKSSLQPQLLQPLPKKEQGSRPHPVSWPHLPSPETNLPSQVPLF